MSFWWLYLIKGLVLISDGMIKLCIRSETKIRQKHGPNEFNLSLRVCFSFFSSHPQGHCTYANAILSVSSSCQASSFWYLKRIFTEADQKEKKKNFSQIREINGTSDGLF